MANRKRWLIVAQIALLSPALLFLGAVTIQMIHPTRAADQIVMWYAARMWTLWSLLIALPLAVLVSGGWALLRQRRPASNAAIMRVTTAVAGFILVVVALHMAAN
jgi:threonine/homoserine/homoserine lactone efflux protein